MITFIKEGIERIKQTRTYSREKNVPNWFYNVIGSIMLTFIGCTILTLFGIVFVSLANPNKIILEVFGQTVKFYPFVLTFLLMIRYGHKLIRFLILMTSYIQKAMMKSINYLDMYFWKKTGKDSIVSNFIVKHNKFLKFGIYGVLIIRVIILMISNHGKL